MYSYKSWSYFNFEYVPSLLNLEFLWTFCASVFHFPVSQGGSCVPVAVRRRSHRPAHRTPSVVSHVPVRF